MAAPRFFVDGALPRPWVPGGLAEIGEAAARHLQVLRLAAGDPITLFDGLGGEFSGVINAIGKRRAQIELTAFDPVERESPLTITLVQALATSDKMDLIVQKAVELGVTRIQPVATERATLKLAGDRAQKRTAHWQSIAQAACEQCGRNRVPAVAEVLTLEAWLASPVEGLRLLMHPAAASSLAGGILGTQPVALLIGPEGGFSAGERALAAGRQVTAVRFGPRVLRTETAGLAALAALNALYGDLR
jgi:16S rRNA (uracil1498-N3)-methyltransferase